MTLLQMRKCVPFWLEILNLREWTIKLRWATKAEGKECQGLNYFSVEELKSTVVIDRKVKPADREETLVHELLHLVFDGHEVVDTDKYDPLHERALNRTASALMKLAYPAPGDTPNV